MVKHSHLIEKAIISIYTQDFEGAIRILKYILTLENKCEFDNDIKANIFALISTCYMYMSDESSAYEMLKQSISLKNDNSETLSNFALLLYGQHRYLEAIEYSKASIEIDKNEVNAYLNLGNSYLALNNRIDALQTYKDGLKNNPDNIQCFYNIIKLESFLGLFKSAEEHIYELRIKHPNSLVTYFVIVSYFLEHKILNKEQQSKIKQYIGILDKEISEKHLTKLLYGIYYCNIGRYDTGFKLFVELIKAGLNHPAPYLYVARLFYSKGDFELCRKYYQMALKYKDYTYSIIKIHDTFYFRLNDKCHIPSLETSIEYMKAAIEYHNQNHEEAIKIFLNAVSKINHNHFEILNKSKITLFRFRSCQEYDMATIRNNGLWFSDLSKFNDSFEGELLNIYNSTDEFLDLMKNYKACCFFDNPEGYLDTRMWDLYANKSKGICIEYELDLSQLTNNNNVYFDRVTYSNHFYQDTTSLHWMIHNCFFRKDPAWMAENEVRILYFDNDVNDNGVEVSLEKLGLKMKNIYMGRKIAPKHKIELHQIFQNTSVGVFIIENKDSSFQLQVKQY